MKTFLLFLIWCSVTMAAYRLYYIETDIHSMKCFLDGYAQEAAKDPYLVHP
jgi:hypothetical protein